MSMALKWMSSCSLMMRRESGSSDYIYSEAKLAWEMELPNMGILNECLVRVIVRFLGVRIPC
jgi:hypothetical protein